MEFIIGGDAPKEGMARLVRGFKHIVDWDRVNLPKYNPRQFTLCRNLDGLTKSQYAKKAGLSYKRYSDIEAGNVIPTEEEVDAILNAQGHVIKGFYEQWPETEPDFSQVVAVPVAIDYYKYKVFRDINRPQSMKAVT